MKTIIAHGQQIEGPDAAHFMNAQAGRGSGCILAHVRFEVGLEHRDGLLEACSQIVRGTMFMAMDRRRPRCIKAARTLATFFHN